MSRYINVKDTPSSYTTEWKFQFVLTIGKAKIANVIQHTRSCSSYWAAICFYLINQSCGLYIAFGTFFFYILWRDSCEIFLIHEEQFALVSKPMH